MFQLILTVAGGVAFWRLHARVVALEELVDLLQSEIGRLDDELECKMPR